MVFGLVSLACFSFDALAAEVEIYRADSRQALAKGDFDGVGVDPRGRLVLARQVTRLGGLEEPFVFAAAGHRDGWVVGTGSGGKVLLVKADGATELLATLPEPQVFAVAVDGDGTVYAATSPDGKVYRLRDGEAEPFFEPQETYIWDLAIDAQGALLVATGLDAKLYRVQTSGRKTSGRGEVLYEVADVHLRTLLPRPDGSVVMGTAGQGLILERSPKGDIRTLHDATHPEIVALTADAQGHIYAALLASEASRLDLSATVTKAKTDGDGDGDGVMTVTVGETGETTIGSRSAGFKGARSIVIELDPAGGFEELSRFVDQTVHSVLFHDGELWIGTGEEGRLYRRQGEGVMEERQLEEKQIVAMAAGGAGLAALTANGSAAYRLGAKPVAEGTYTSEILDLEEMSRLGSFQWQGGAPRGSAVELAFRSGLSSLPDATWSAWRDLPCTEGCDTAGRRREVSLAEVPNGRFVQWRAKLTGHQGVSPSLEVVELSYRQENQRPRIAELEVLAPGEILVSSSFNPTNQAYEPWSPNRESIFTTLEEGDRKETSSLKTLWKRGYRTLRWKAEDANDDTLTYHLEVRPQGSTERQELPWMSIAEDLDTSYLSFDSSVLPDGIYHFRLSVDDSAGRGDADALVARQETSPVVIDHSPAQWLRGRAVEGGFEIEARDALSPLRQADYSVDGGAWRQARAVDGLLDGRREALRLEVAGEPRIVLLRLTDAAHNVVTFNVLSEVKPPRR